MAQFSLEEQIEREMACMKYLLERASIAHRNKDYCEAQGFIRAMDKSKHQVMELQKKLDEQERIKSFAADMKKNGIQIHHLVYQTKNNHLAEWSFRKNKS